VQDVLEAFCNLGYASGCSWSPQERVWDAVRFAVSAPQDSTGRHEAGNVPARFLILRFVCERDHRPAADGDLEFDLSRAIWVRRHDDARIQKMAECFLDAYLKRKA
jgi:hypothetical protein